MIELFLIRHGEAVGQGNYLGRRSDPDLSAEGREQVLALKPILNPADNYRIYSSPMKRALETSTLLFNVEGSKDINVIDGFAEMDFGEWDGLGWQEISARDDKKYRAWLDDPIGLRPPGGENLDEFNSRVDKVFNSVMEHCRRCGVEKVFITAHGGVVRSILCLLLDLPAENHWSFKIDPASVSCIKIFSEAGQNRPCRIDFLNLTAY